MSGGYENLPTDPLEELRRELIEQRRRLDALEKPSGTQLNGLPEFAVASTSTTSVSVTTSYANIVTLSLTVPDGFTRGLVSGYGDIAMLPSFSSSALHYGYARIVAGGSVGPENRVSLHPDFIVEMTVSPSYSVSLTGLTPGTSVSVSLQARLSEGSANLVQGALLSANAIFLR